MTVQIVPGREDEAWQLLGKAALAYGDNGGDPDGNAWLPISPLPGAAAERVVQAGAGHMVPVLYARDDAMIRELRLGQRWPEDPEEGEEETLINAMQEAANGETRGWAHYGTYGTVDSAWVFIPLDLE